MKCVLAVTVLALSVYYAPAHAEGGSFKADFNLQAKSAVVSEGKLTLEGVSPVVFAVESGAETAYGVTESSNRFLERWAELDHDIRPHGVLFTSGKPVTNGESHDGAYRALKFDIDNPMRDGDADWVFEIDHVEGAADVFKEPRVIEPVMLTIVMAHTPEEVAAGRVCGPWDVSDLRDQSGGAPRDPPVSCRRN